MKPNYNNLWKLLIEKGMTKTELRVKAEMSTSTLAKMGKNEVVSMNVIIKICEILDCNISDVMTVDKISEQTSLYIIYNIQEARQQGKLLGVLEKEERQDRQKIKKSLAYFPNMKKARFRNRVFCLGNDSYFMKERHLCCTKKLQQTKSTRYCVLFRRLFYLHGLRNTPRRYAPQWFQIGPFGAENVTKKKSL